jgi:hypothetical protein
MSPGRDANGFGNSTRHYIARIIGTCLTQGELREILRRIARGEGFSVVASSDHELHSLGVRLAARRDGPGKLLYKALDRRHAAAIRRFAAAKDESALEAEWEAALASAAIPAGTGRC